MVHNDRRPAFIRLDACSVGPLDTLSTSSKFHLHYACPCMLFFFGQIEESPYVLLLEPSNCPQICATCEIALDKADIALATPINSHLLFIDKPPTHFSLYSPALPFRLLVCRRRDIVTPQLRYNLTCQSQSVIGKS